VVASFGHLTFFIPQSANYHGSWLVGKHTFGLAPVCAMFEVIDAPLPLAAGLSEPHAAWLTLRVRLG
jgi:hypothetical protein